MKGIGNKVADCIALFSSSIWKRSRDALPAMWENYGITGSTQFGLLPLFRLPCWLRSRIFRLRIVPEDGTYDASDTRMRSRVQCGSVDPDQHATALDHLNTRQVPVTMSEPSMMRWAARSTLGLESPYLLLFSSSLLISVDFKY